MAERHVGLVRAVMQGREGLTRGVLLQAVEDAGGRGPRTHRSTGNVSFTAADGVAVCAAVSAQLGDLLGRPTPVVHRSLAQLQALVERRPFAHAGPGEHLVLLATVDLGPVVRQLELPEGLDVVAIHGADACVVRRTSRHPHPMPLLEGAGVDPVTSRSIGTVAHVATAAVA